MKFYILLVSLFSISICLGKNIDSTLTVLTPLYTKQLTDSTLDRLSFIGEVKGKSYIKIVLSPIPGSAVYKSGSSDVLKYKGSYYESVTGKKYSLTGNFNLESRIWTFRCFNRYNQPVFIFSGKQKIDGSVEGMWKSKKLTHPFYLRPS